MNTNYRINYFSQIKSFYSIVFNSDFEIRPVHISLYLFLLNQNNRINWVEWFKCPYDLAMAGACINSKNTYYKALDDLQRFNLIEYEKGINLFKAPKIKILVLNTESSVLKNDTLCEPLTEQLSEPLSEMVSEQLSKKVTEPLSELLNDNIYKLITDNYELINNKLETWLKIPSELKESEQIPFQEIIEIFNSVCIDLPKVEKITSQRKKIISARVKEYSFEVLGTVFQKTNQSDFLSGRKTSWKANFDWLMNPTNFIKVLEDNYKNNSSNGTEKSNAQIFSEAVQSDAAKYNYFDPKPFKGNY